MSQFSWLVPTRSNTGDSLVKNMVVCLFHDIESGGNKCITDFHRGSESGIRRNVCRNQIRLLPATPFGVVGIGIGIHGTVCRNEITFTPNYDLADLPIKDTLEDALEIPVWLENEANLSALAEKTFPPTGTSSP